ncbi:NAD-dependent epimerase/dehydratase family protein [Neorhizobium sp. BETTINA12A]|uniref:NAD-dependent epimerase/dehydratase family protein n=1 Tax=Neorhizobium sp. BETTINA12A TaxID=2908924 RepID=UPI001FF6EECA|nr:NAD-dependent epimerase/dehydratase family protein [Neorhizobium sp. BETTINA12A]MCJ9750400.1 NAD-dependent epimerase/dehydratase family protein [Neorhizobium sp. BETTINA12A]
MSIVILGGTGFIGSQVVRAFGARDITLFHRNHVGSAAGPTRHVHCSRDDLPTMRKYFLDAEPNLVIDMIAQCKDSATKALAMIAPFSGRVAMISSASVYRQYGQLLRIEAGPVGIDPVTEDGPLRTRLFPYRQSILRSATDPRRWLDDYDKIPAENAYLSHPGITASVARLPMVFGPGDPDGRVQIYIRLMQSGIKELFLSESVAGWKNARGYVENVASAIAHVASHGAVGQVYNVADAGDLPEAEWVERIGRAAGWSGRITIVPDDDPAAIMPIDELPRDADFSVNTLLDSTRIRAELGFAEVVDLDEALRRTVAATPHRLQDAI